MPPLKQSSALDLEIESRQKKGRHRHTPAQVAALNELYEQDEHPSLQQRTSLGVRIGLETKVVNSWFTNKRAALKKRFAREGQLNELSSHTSTARGSNSTPSVPQTHLDEDADYYPHHSLVSPGFAVSAEYIQNSNNVDASQRSSDPTSGNKRMRMRPSSDQRDELKALFDITQHPTKEQREQLSERIGMPYQSITNWFQNQRSHLKNRGEERDIDMANPPAVVSRSASYQDMETESTFLPSSLGLAHPPTSGHPSLGYSLSLPPLSNSHPSLSASIPNRRLRSTSATPSAASVPSSRRSSSHRGSTPYSAALSTLSRRPRRTRPEAHQLEALKALYDKTPSPSIEQRTALAMEIGMEIGKVTNWFRNLRQTARKRAQKQNDDDDDDDEEEDDNDGELDQDNDYESVSHPDSVSTSATPTSRMGSPSFPPFPSSRSHSSFTSGETYSEHVDGRTAHSRLEGVVGHGSMHSDDGESEDEYQEALTPSPSPPPSSYHPTRRHPHDSSDNHHRHNHLDRSTAGAIPMIIERVELKSATSFMPQNVDQNRAAAARFPQVKLDDALLLLSFHQNVH